MAFATSFIKKMKKLLFLIVTLLVFTCVKSQDSTKTLNLNPYAAIGISVPNTTNFLYDSYLSVEGGVSIDNVSLALVLGVNNLKSFDAGIEYYWYEGKVAHSFPLGILSGYGVFGIGSYIDKKGPIFIEYGAGISKAFYNSSLYIQVSSWNRVVYFTSGISYSF